MDTMQSGIFIEEVPHKLTDLQLDAEGGATAPKSPIKGFICGFISKGDAFNIVGDAGVPNVYTDRIEAAAVATFWLTVYESQAEQAGEQGTSAEATSKTTQGKKPLKGKNTPRAVK